jgi:hypothetical protein
MIKLMLTGKGITAKAGYDAGLACSLHPIADATAGDSLMDCLRPYSSPVPLDSSTL